MNLEKGCHGFLESWVCTQRTRNLVEEIVCQLSIYNSAYIILRSMMLSDSVGNQYLILLLHYCDVIISIIASQITSLTIIYSTVYSGTDQRKHQSPASLAFVRGIHRGPVNSPHKRPVTRKMLPFDDVITKHCVFLLDRVGIITFTSLSS